MPQPRRDLVGKRFGRLVVLHRSSKNIRRWICRCDCGAMTDVWRAGLRTGQTKSCGCLARYLSSQRERTHGMSKSVEFRTWLSAKQRCNNMNVHQYRNYGARGIRVCDEWLHDFEAFYRDMGPRPSSRHSLDRIDSDGPYSPTNCRWAEVTVQNNNQRRNKRLTFRGETRTLSEWAKSLGMGKTTLDERLKHGWTIERALTTRVYK